MRYENVDTHHMVDDDLAPQDVAFETFRKAFCLTCCFVDEDGLTMRYRLKNATNARVWETNARKIITALNLPLKADLEIWEVGHLVFDFSLNITYKPL